MEIKHSLSADDMIMYLENYKEYTSKSLELINELIKFAGYKINIPKCAMYLYTNKLSERNKFKNLVENHIKKNKIPRNKQPSKWKVYILKTIKHQWRKLKVMQRNGKILHAFVLE